ncbi:MAG: hypothetical protein JWR07_5714 [Nevskia sp.]|nr:hypothetical protein [Nevskia sp.]
MCVQNAFAERMSAFTDEAVAMIVTITVLELNAPLLLAITWANYRHALRFVFRTTPRLLWVGLVRIFVTPTLAFAGLKREVRHA